MERIERITGWGYPLNPFPESGYSALLAAVAETARQAEWEKPSFMRELFLGRFRLDLIHPFPLPGPERPEFSAFYPKLHDFLRDEVVPAEIDRTGEYPPKCSTACGASGPSG